ncbi:MAG: hypothetical protein ACOC2N_07945, partial [Spirochaetota bacterium]
MTPFMVVHSPLRIGAGNAAAAGIVERKEKHPQRHAAVNHGGACQNSGFSVSAGRRTAVKQAHGQEHNQTEQCLGKLPRPLKDSPEHVDSILSLR